MAWMKSDGDGPYAMWHLEVPAKATSLAGRVHTACGRTFSDSDPFDERDSIDGIPDSDRCPVCQGVHVTRIQGWI